MDALLWLVIGLSLLVTIISGIATIVVAFRRSVLWGLVYLFVPLGNLVFIILHWHDAKKSVLISIASGLIAIGAMAALPAGALPSLVLKSPSESAADLTAEIQEKRDRIYHLETTFAEGGPRLTKQFSELEARRKALNVTDTAAVNEFNAAAAAYQQENAFRKAMLQEIEAERTRLDELLAQRARTAPSSPAAGGGSSRIVMYTTARCPACVQAKRYMAQRGISYEERDVERSPADFAEFQRLGGRGVPLILVGDKRMEGFNPSALEAML